MYITQITNKYQYKLITKILSNSIILLTCISNVIFNHQLILVDRLPNIVCI